MILLATWQNWSRFRSNPEHPVYHDPFLIHFPVHSMFQSCSSGPSICFFIGYNQATPPDSAQEKACASQLPVAPLVLQGGGLSCAVELSEQSMCYVMYADISLGSFSIGPPEPQKPAISAGVEAIVNQLLALYHLQTGQDIFQPLQFYKKKNLHTVAFCAPHMYTTHHITPLYWFDHTIVTRMQPIDRVPYAAFASNWPTTTTPSQSAYHSRSTE